MNLGPPEIMMIVVLAMFLLGPDKIPEVARWLAKAYRELGRLRQQVDSTLDDVKRDLKIDEELVRPLDSLAKPSAAASLIRPPQGERATASASTLPAQPPTAPDTADRALFEALPVPEEDDYLSPVPTAAPPITAAHVPASVAALTDPGDYLGSAP